MLICNHWFHAVFIQQSSGRKKKDFGEIEKIENIQSNECLH